MRLTNCVNGSAFDKWRSEGYKWAMDKKGNALDGLILRQDGCR